MYLKIGSRLRPLAEVKTPSISYKPVYDNLHRMIYIDETWQIQGRLVIQTNASQTAMTNKLAILDADYSQVRPDLVFLEDNGVTPSALKLLASDCIDGPNVVESSFPSDGQDIYATGMLYSVTFQARRMLNGAGGNPILEFSETVAPISPGGRIDGFVGGAINLPERQIFKQSAPYMYVQSGRAIGLFGWPDPPIALWPGALLSYKPPTKVSPRIAGPIPQEFEIQWEYEFGHVFPLAGNPHITI